MSQIPEDLLQSIMQMTGMSRREAEKALTQSFAEMTNGPIFKAQTSKKKGRRGAKPKYDEENYPHYLPSDNIKKYTIRVSLKGITPTIWRKFECPSNISLRHLTELVLRLMGWWNEHLNHIVGAQDTFYVPFYQYDPSNAWGENLYQEEYMLSDLLTEKGKTLRWEYDFGDSWQHDIRLSSIDEYEEGEPHDIIFKSGKGACPPEDCGGIFGYQDLLALHAKRKSRKRLTSEEKERLEWYGIDKDYDPEDFDEYECIDLCDYFSADEEPPFSCDSSAESTPSSDKVSCSPPVEKESFSLYDDILSLSFRIRELEPWEDLNDSDIYAIRMQDGSEIYIATMGYGGETFDVQLYDGADSLRTYILSTKAERMQPYEIVDMHNWADYKSIMFQDPEDGIMLPKQYHQIEQWAKAHHHDIEDAHGYPFPLIFRPHRYPTMQMSNEELSRLKEALEAIVWFSQQILDADDLTEFGFKNHREYATEKGGKVVPLVVKTPEGYKVERTKLPGLTHNFASVTLSESDLQPLRSLPKKGTVLIRLIHLPGYVGDEHDPDQSYIALTLFMVEKKTQMISMSELCEITDRYEHDVLLQYINKVKTSGCIPQRIITDDPRTEAMLKPFCHQLGIILDFKRTRIPELAEACQYMYDMSI